MNLNMPNGQQDTEKVEINSKPMQLALSLVKYNTEKVFSLLLKTQIFNVFFYF